MFQTLFGDPTERKIQEYSEVINKINKLVYKLNNFKNKNNK